MSFAVVTDSLAGLPLEEVASRGLVVIPLSYYMNGEEHTCQAPEEYDSAAFFRAMKQRVEVKTSMIPPQRFAEYWEPLLQSDLDILFLSASSGISSSYQSATIAAQQLEESYPERKIRVVDTLSSTLGEGLLVLRAFALREKGMSLDETADTILSLRPYIAHYFTVDDLLYISRGGARLRGQGSAGHCAGHQAPAEGRRARPYRDERQGPGPGGLHQGPGGEV